MDRPVAARMRSCPTAVTLQLRTILADGAVVATATVREKLFKLAIIFKGEVYKHIPPPHEISHRGELPALVTAIMMSLLGSDIAHLLVKAAQTSVKVRTRARTSDSRTTASRASYS